MVGKTTFGLLLRYTSCALQRCTKNKFQEASKSYITFNKHFNSFKSFSLIVLIKTLMYQEPTRLHPDLSDCSKVIKTLLSESGPWIRLHLLREDLLRYSRLKKIALSKLNREWWILVQNNIFSYLTWCKTSPIKKRQTILAVPVECFSFPRRYDNQIIVLKFQLSILPKNGFFAGCVK